MKSGKRILLCCITSLMLVLLMAMPVSVSAAGNVARNETTDTEYATLAQAVEEANAGDTVTLLQSTTEDGIIIDKSLTIDLNENTVNGGDDPFYVFAVVDSSVSVEIRNGEISVNRENIASNPSVGMIVQSGNVTLTDVDIEVVTPSTAGYSYGVYINDTGDIGNDKTNVTLSGCTINERGGGSEDNQVVGVGVFGKYDNADGIAGGQEYSGETVLNIDSSTIDVSGFAVSGNGARHGVEIGITDSDLTSGKATAIYNPQYGTTKISGGSITGLTGIEVRAGNIETSNGTKITATAASTTVSSNGNGTTTLGAAIAVAQHSTTLPIDIVIKDAELSGASALVANNPQNNSADNIAKVNVTIENGSFDGLVETNDGGKITAEKGTFGDLDESVTVNADDIAEITGKDGSKTTVLGLDNINEALKNLGTGDSVTITAASADSEFTAPDGVEVSNESGQEIVLNGESLADSDSATAHVHRWGEPVWKWAKDNSATVTFTCTKDASHVETPEVTVTTEKTAATCTEDGKMVYTAKAVFNGMEYTNIKTVVIPAAGHDYENGVCTICGAKEVAEEVASDSSAKTGDDFNAAPLIALMGLAVVGAAGTALYSRKKRMQ